MSARAADDAALRIGRFALAVWAVGLLILAAALALAVPRLVPHLFSAGTGAAAGSGVEVHGPGSYSGSRNASIAYQRPAGYNGPFEIVVDSDDEVTVAVDNPADPEWPTRFLWSSGEWDEPETEVLATTRQTFTLHIEAGGDWDLAIRQPEYTELHGSPVSGTGNALLRYDGDEVLGAFSFTGESNIAVYTLQETDQQLMVNEIGDYSTRFSWQPHPVTYFKVEAFDGQWTFDVGG